MNNLLPNQPVEIEASGKPGRGGAGSTQSGQRERHANRRHEIEPADRVRQMDQSIECHLVRARRQNLCIGRIVAICKNMSEPHLAVHDIHRDRADRGMLLLPKIPAPHAEPEEDYAQR
ncbi:MAG: hypothetical protein ACLPSF_10475 [Methylocella sp.]